MFSDITWCYSCSDHIKNVTLVCSAADFLIAQNHIGWLNNLGLLCNSIHSGSPSEKDGITLAFLCVGVRKVIFKQTNLDQLRQLHSSNPDHILAPCQSVLVL